MRLARALLAAVLIADVGSTPAVADRGCVPKDARTVLKRSGATHIYTQRVPFNQYGGRLLAVYACRPGHRVRLGNREPGGTSSGVSGYATKIVTAGHYVAVYRFSGNYDSDGYHEVRVINVQSEQTLTRRATGQRPPESNLIGGIGPVEDLVLRHDGSVAWIASLAVDPPMPRYEIWAGRGRDVQRVTSAPTELSDLQLGASRVAWSQDGVKASAARPDQ